MFLTKYKRILLALLLLAFTSQSIAFEFMSCHYATQTPASSTDSSMDMNMHMGHSMSMTDQLSDDARSEEMDCCNTSCECISGTCAPVVLFSAANGSFIQSTNFYTGLESAHFPDRAISSIYKPPISR